MDEKGDFYSLHKAASEGNLKLMQQLISQGFDLDVNDHEQNTALMAAASSGHVEVLKLLIDHRANLNTVNILGETALMCAIKARKDDAALILVDAGADLNVRDYNSENAAVYAVRFGAIEILDRLLSLGVDVHCLNDEGESPLCVAYKDANTKVVKAFIERGLIDNRIDNHGNNLLIMAVRSGDVDLLDILVNAKANLDVQNENKFSALMLAVQDAHLQIIDLLIKAGAQLDLANKYGDTALTIACRDGIIAIVTTLLNHGANIEEGGCMRITPLMQAAYHCQLEVVNELLQSGADVNACNVDGESALATLCHSRQCYEDVHDVCQMLVEHGADINLQDCNGLPSLPKAIMNKNAQFAQTLISFGADVDFVTCTARFRRKETPLIMAVRMGVIEVVKCLIGHKANVNTTDRYQMSALHIVASTFNDKDAESMIPLFVQAGADLDSGDGDDLRPLMLASREGRTTSVKCLIEAGACVNARQEIAEKSALGFAAECNNSEIVEILMHAGTILTDELHRATRFHAKHSVRTMIINGALPTYYDPDDPIHINRTPFYISLTTFNSPMANYFYSIWFLNKFDINNIPTNKALEKRLGSSKKRQTYSLFQRLSSQPWRLQILSFVAVSSAVGFQAGRSERVNKLNVPEIFKRRLLYNDEDAKLPVEKWGQLRFD